MIGLAAAKADQFIAVLLSKIGACVLVFGVLFLIGFLISLFLFLFFLVSRVPLVRGQRIQGVR